MRKMFLSALACVAFAGSSFASNEVVNINKSSSEEDVPSLGICRVWIDLYDQKGNYLGTEYYWTATSSSAACDLWAQRKKDEVVAQKNKEIIVQTDRAAIDS